MASPDTAVAEERSASTADVRRRKIRSKHKCHQRRRRKAYAAALRHRSSGNSNSSSDDADDDDDGDEDEDQPPILVPIEHNRLPQSRPWCALGFFVLAVLLSMALFAIIPRDDPGRQREASHAAGQVDLWRRLQQSHVECIYLRLAATHWRRPYPGHGTCE